MDIPLMDICHWPPSMTKTYGHSLKKCHLPRSMTKKLSLTMVNDKKNCHWLKGIYIGIVSHFFALQLSTSKGEQIFKRIDAYMPFRFGVLWTQTLYFHFSLCLATASSLAAKKCCSSQPKLPWAITLERVKKYSRTFLVARVRILSMHFKQRL